MGLLTKKRSPTKSPKQTTVSIINNWNEEEYKIFSWYVLKRKKIPAAKSRINKATSAFILVSWFFGVLWVFDFFFTAMMLEAYRVIVIVSSFSASGAVTVTLLFASFTTVYPVLYPVQTVKEPPEPNWGSSGRAGI